jgi:hypothetical protein
MGNLRVKVNVNITLWSEWSFDIFCNYFTNLAELDFPFGRKDHPIVFECSKYEKGGFNACPMLISCELIHQFRILLFCPKETGQYQSLLKFHDAFILVRGWALSCAFFVSLSCISKCCQAHQLQTKRQVFWVWQLRLITGIETMDWYKFLLW